MGEALQHVPVLYAVFFNVGFRSILVRFCFRLDRMSRGLQDIRKEAQPCMSQCHIQFVLLSCEFIVGMGKLCLYTAFFYLICTGICKSLPVRMSRSSWDVCNVLSGRIRRRGRDLYDLLIV